MQSSMACCYARLECGATFFFAKFSAPMALRCVVCVFPLRACFPHAAWRTCGQHCIESFCCHSRVSLSLLLAPLAAHTPSHALCARCVFVGRPSLVHRRLLRANHHRRACRFLPHVSQAARSGKADDIATLKQAEAEAADTVRAAREGACLSSSCAPFARRQACRTCAAPCRSHTFACTAATEIEYCVHAAAAAVGCARRVRRLQGPVRGARFEVGVDFAADARFVSRPLLAVQSAR
jgi:hypothetical protein